MIQLSARYRQSDDIVTRKVMDDILLVPIKREIANMDYVFTINHAGYFIWSQLDGSSSLDQITELVANRYDAPLETIKRDVCALLSELSAAGLACHCQGNDYKDD